MQTSSHRSSRWFVTAALGILLCLAAVFPAVQTGQFQPPPGDFQANEPQPISNQVSQKNFSRKVEKEIEPTPAVLIGAGDITVCGQDGDDRTAALIERLIVQYPQAEIFTAGDNTQTMGEPYEYADCFDRTWGRLPAPIHPSPGNHDWFIEKGANYFSYFGEAAGDFGLGYYSYDVGGWHIVSLNSNCNLEDCGEASAQAQWFRADLQANQAACTLVYWHHPLRSSGIVPINPGGETLWQIASDFDVDVVVNGHDHHYERFAPLDRDGRVNQVSGMRSFIVGTGGAWLFDLGEPLAITEAMDNTTYGVILFLLYPYRYEWKFTPVSGSYFSDAGAGVCSMTQ